MLFYVAENRFQEMSFSLNKFNGKTGINGKGMRKLTILLLLLWLGSSVASNENQRYFDKNQSSFGFYEKNVLPRFLPEPPSPIFFHSRARVDYGATIFYERNIFHTTQYFSINAGSSLSAWSLDTQIQLALSGFFVFRVWLFRTHSFSPYIAWSIAGPTLLSSPHFSHYQLGNRFIFQDFLGIGAIVGKAQSVVISFKMYHYSNGDLFLHNDGFNVPIVLSIGYAFN
ncbi:acyloxyacyl hydrolase [Candidiatus Paracoxiella cheracis]|uniref:acyloxyacyl hydrolase n=1 Tax=Candidiatus Paracoxiella cheracis TaxID=3405120 RepID=UPI003BF51DB3